MNADLVRLIMYNSMPKESAIAREWKIILELFYKRGSSKLKELVFIPLHEFYFVAFIQSGRRMGPYDWNLLFINVSRPLQLKVNIYMFSWKGEMQ